MFLPISRSIYCGALSPSALEACHCTDECLRRDVQRLMFLPARLSELTELLSDVLGSYGVELPPFPSAVPFPSERFCFPDLHTSLSAMREDELDCMLRLTPDMEVFTLRFRFYEALLRGEVRWLKLNIGEQIEKLHSHNEARMLLLRVLDEIYLFIGQAGNSQGGLKVALGELYLDLTIVFGSLLHATDYLDYHTLQYSVCSGRRTLPDEEKKYAILLGENRVKAIVNELEIYFLGRGTTDFRGLPAPTARMLEERAGRLYGELVTLITALSAGLALPERFLRGVTALENYLFFYYSGLPVEKGDHYKQFTDGNWLGCRFNDFRQSHYSEGYRYSEARTAYDWIDRQLDERCFTFLSPLIAPEGSLARLLRAYLQKQRTLYQDNFASSFVPVGREGGVATVASIPVTPKVVDESEVHRILAFLYDETASWLSQPRQALHLENLFCHFLHTGDIPSVPADAKVKICSGRSELLYGLFLHYCKVRKGGDTDSCAKFLREVLDTQITLDTLHKNVSRYVDKKYIPFCKENNLNLWLVSSGRDAEGK